MYTSWFNAHAVGVGHANDRDYSFAAVRASVVWPSVLRFVEAEVSSALNASAASAVASAWVYEKSNRAALRLADGSELRAENVPHHPRPYINDFVPECAWAMVKDWPRRKVWQPPACLTRSLFLRAYRKVQSELRPKGALLCGRPPPRSYIALHVRRGDRLGHAGKAERQAKRTNALAERVANATAFSSVILNALRPIGAATRLPFLLLTDDEAYRAVAEAALREAGLQVLPVAAAATAAAACAHFQSNMADGGAAEARILSDFFALKDAAGVVAIAPLAIESSFATVSALAGGAPHLTPFPKAIGPRIASYARCAPSGNLENVFFLEHLDAYIQQVLARKHLWAPHHER